jgi:hypothetical protein
MYKEIKELTNAIYCMVEAMGMNAENDMRKYRGESPAHTEDSFQVSIRFWREKDRV